MNITVFVTKNCRACQRAKMQIDLIMENRNDINLSVVDLQKTRSEGIVIVPALFIEDQLFSYGEIDEVKFINRIIVYSSRN